MSFEPDNFNIEKPIDPDTFMTEVEGYLPSLTPGIME